MANLDEPPPAAAPEGDETKLDDEIDAMRRRVHEVESQLESTRREQGETESVDASSRSVYIGQVDYSTTPLELHELFKHCGEISRVTILCDKWTGHPKGFAYIEFHEDSAVDRAVGLHDVEFKGRRLKVLPKRENLPGKGRPSGGGKRGKGSWGGWGQSWYSPYPTPGSKGKGKGRKKCWY
eukprot:TRINITY_DN6620_c3_g1_i1.p1 TRINITY_DN6620_c3_g1~~TRINITY_DN6620_c3_g1_i1.p1  ORF type:complete len:181 (+),score=54.53 TRINITY_DN6620_c3_g1_i1:83-625(+)